MRGGCGADGPRRVTARLIARAKAILHAEGLDEAGRWVLPHIRPSIELVPGKRAPRPLHVGISKIGGCPDLPASAKWPVDREKRALSFLLQVALGELPVLDGLPQEGMLSFFYDTSNMPESTACFAAKSAQVLYHAPAGDRQLCKRQAPTDEDGPTTDTFEEFPLKASLVPSFPDDLTLLAEPTARGDYLAAVVNPERSVFKLLGHPNTIQTPMQIQCAMVARGLVPESDGLAPPEAAKLKRQAEQWVLLLQVDSSEDIQLSWGDSGRLYWWIARKDLEARRFGRTVLFLQSH
jgi:hypothetical protein